MLSININILLLIIYYTLSYTDLILPPKMNIFPLEEIAASCSQIGFGRQSPNRLKHVHCNVCKFSCQTSSYIFVLFIPPDIIMLTFLLSRSIN